MNLVDLTIENLGQFSFDILPQSEQTTLVYYKTYIHDTNENLVGACQDLSTCSVSDLMSNTEYTIKSTGHLNETFFTDESITSVTTLDDFPKAGFQIDAPNFLAFDWRRAPSSSYQFENFSKLELKLKSVTFNSVVIKGEFTFKSTMEKKSELFSFRQIDSGNEIEITCRYTSDGEIICNADELTPHTSYELQYTINYELGTTSDSLSFVTLALPPKIQEITIFSTDFHVSWEPQTDATAYNALITIDGIDETMESILGETKLKFGEEFEEISLNVQPERYAKYDDIYIGGNINVTNIEVPLSLTRICVECIYGFIQQGSIIKLHVNSRLAVINRNLLRWIPLSGLFLKLISFLVLH